MNENPLDIIQAIKERADKEYEQGKTVRAICRGNINILHAGTLKSRCIWITNTEPTHYQAGPRFSDGSLAEVTSSGCTALMEGGLVVSKNKTYAQRIL